MAAQQTVEQARTVFYGFVVGDALGVPVEFKTRDTYTVTDMQGYGTFDQPPGTWSDDTSLTLALMEHLAEGSDCAALMDKFLAYFQQGYLTPYGHCFDIGVATQEAIERYRGGASLDEIGGDDERSNGNGALMRIAPLALWLKEADIHTLFEQVSLYTSLTHAHPRSVVASVLYVYLLRELLAGRPLTEALQNTREAAEAHLATGSDCAQEYERHFRAAMSPALWERDRSQIRSSGYVVDSFEAALWCLGTSTSYSEAVLKAVNLGTDTDTVAAITGPLAGAVFGLDDRAERWMGQLANRELLDQVLDAFTQALTARAGAVGTI